VGKQTRSENTRLHLVRSAAELFDLNGFAGATVDDVSRAAGVTKGAFYFHFSSKDELSWAIQDEARSLLRAAVYRKAAAGLPALQSVVDLTHELAWWLEHEPLVRASFRTARECGHRGAPFLDFHLDWLSTIETLLTAAAKSGTLRENVVIDDAVTLVLSAASGIEILWWAGVRRGSIRESLAGIWQLVLPGIAAPDHLRELRPAGTTGFDAGARS
jgi:AcrR family transcriptional regulator